MALGRLFIFGTSKEGAYFFLEKQPKVQNKTLIYIKKGTIKETVTVTNIRLTATKSEEKIIPLRELCTHMDIMVEKL